MKQRDWNFKDTLFAVLIVSFLIGFQFFLYWLFIDDVKKAFPLSGGNLLLLIIAGSCFMAGALTIKYFKTRSKIN